MTKEEYVLTTKWLGRTLTIKTGKLAKQADAAVTVQYGDTVVLATVVESCQEREGIDFFPLMVDFEERLYAAGIIKGSRWVKREGRPSDESVLTGRMIDRAIRPLFLAESRKEIQVIITVLSVDQENDHDIVSLIAASAALSVSGVTWSGPISGIRVGRINNKFVFNPTYEEQVQSDLDLIVAGTDKKIIMIEARANEVEEADMLKAILAGQAELQPSIELIKKLSDTVKTANKKKRLKTNKLISADELKVEKEKEKIFSQATNWLKENIKPILFDRTYYTKGERKAAVKAIEEGLDKYLFDQGIDRDWREQAIESLVSPMVEAEVTQAVLNEQKRVDGRGLDEIRPLFSEAGILPRNHGSGLFSRGETQIMSIVTLGSPGMEQTLEGLEGMSTKRFMHHYNFPPYCVGETKPIRSPGRREIGHGALAEKALLPVIPNKEDFPYTIRVVSETLSSNGSSSMGATCASCLALMDAGVPIKKAVAGIAMGLASDKDMSRWQILTDIQDLEDGVGGMDFKISGTRDGLTTIQLDTKTNGLTKDIIKKTLTQGRIALNQILDVMAKAIDKPRPDLSPYAPRIISFKIEPSKIREVIGAGGKIINGIIDEYNVSIDIEDDGLVVVCGTDEDKSRQAVDYIKNLVREFTVGEIFAGQVTRLMDFGVFVGLTPGREGMVHVSELAPYHIGKPQDFLKVGDKVTVRVKEIDDQGRVNLTMKGLAENKHLWEEEKGKSEMRPYGGSRFSPRNGAGNNGPGRGRFNNNRDRNRY